ncbi:hypothetical protein [Nocardia sp. NBC_01009]|uniref:hypothetical protein n=1 Tax=Nocardia sp. NBC_01009 TaxID=2975996 RepID=UPI00386D4D0A|nr:hypothetical protein OHA42_20000 [Nocardia sp. NBC_01009]
MSRRWFVSSVEIGAAAVARSTKNARPSFTPTVDVRRSIKDQPAEQPRTLPGPDLQLLGPGDTVGFEPSMVVRREPPPGTPDGAADYLALIEFADATLPWLFSIPEPVKRPWLALLVLAAEEGRPQPGRPLWFVNAPAAALPDLADAASWVHVEARVEGDGLPNDAVDRDYRTGLDTVISRLICPRRLEAGKNWIACVVPTTKAGREAGLNKQIPADGAAQAWSPGQQGGVLLPVYDWWEFSTGEEGTFEDLARRIEPVAAATLPGFGSRPIDVHQPWPHEQPPAGAPAEVTVKVQGALRLPGSETHDEQWSDPASMQRYRELIKERVDAPAGRKGRVGVPPDRDEKAVAPPLYGSHHTGDQTLPPTGWVRTLNTQVQFRVAAALGTRYVQLEQEFLMARAWEQVGAINEANRLLAATELAEQTATDAQGKHLATMAPAPMTGLADLLRTKVQVADQGSLEQVLADSAVPDGSGSTAFVRLTRPHGALARRCARAAGSSAGEMPTGSVLTTAAGGTEVVPAKPALWFAAISDAVGPMAATSVARDPSSLFAAQTLVGLVGAQQESFTARAAFGGADAARQLAEVGTSMSETMAGGALPVPRPMQLRGLRRSVLAESLATQTPTEFRVSMGIEAIASSVRTVIRPLPLQLARIKEIIPTASVAGRTDTDRRPLRQIMTHPEFGFPIAAEILARWPEWAVPGITTFPDNSATLLEINSGFVEALLVGLNQEFNRELRWREFPTDEAGTPFSRFWPPGGVQPQYGEIALWDPDVPLGEHSAEGAKDLLVLLVRGEVLRRYPGALVLAAKSVDKKVESDQVQWQEPKFVLPVDERTNLYCFDLDEPTVRAQNWMFVVREPMRGAQFGFDQSSTNPYEHWYDLGWPEVPLTNGFVKRLGGGVPPTPLSPDPATWQSADPADFARIIFQRPFQTAFSPNKMLGPV